LRRILLLTKEKTQNYKTTSIRSKNSRTYKI